MKRNKSRKVSKTKNMSQSELANVSGGIDLAQFSSLQIAQLKLGALGYIV